LILFSTNCIFVSQLILVLSSIT